MTDWDQLREVGQELSPPPFDELVRTAGRRDRRARRLVAVTGTLTVVAALGLGFALADDDEDLQPADDPTPPVSETTDAALPDGVLALPAPNPGKSDVALDTGRYRVPLDDSLAFDIHVPGPTYAHSNGVFLATGSVVVKTEIAGEEYGVPGHPCTHRVIERVGPTTTDLVEAIRDLPVYQTSLPTPVELGGAEGTYLEIQIPVAYDDSECANGIVMPSNPSTAVRVDPGYRSRWWILDVDGRRVVIQQNCTCSADQLDRAAIIVEGITFAAVP